MSRPDPASNSAPVPTTEARARNGGTSAPGGGSVWDITPVVDDHPSEPELPVGDTETARSPTTEPIRPTEPLLTAAPERSAEPLVSPRPTSPSDATPEPARDVPQTPNARQRERARRQIAAAATGRPSTHGAGRSLLVIAALAAAAVLAALVVWALVLRGGDEAAAAIPVGTLPPTESAPPSTVDLADLDEGSAPVEEVVESAPPTAVPASIATTASRASARSTVEGATPSTTNAPSTTAASTEVSSDATGPTTTVPTVMTTTAPPAATTGPRIVIESRRAPCKFGTDCLVAGFRLVGFDAQPDSFVCEFADGSRFTIPFADMSVDYACATATPGESITIEIDGIRSDTALHD